MSEGFKPKIDVLPAAQLRLWDELRDIPHDFVLYGGTAIALHLGHRQSIDFDFFGSTEFDPEHLLQTVPFLRDAKVIQKSPNTLTATIDRTDPVQVSFLGVPSLRRLKPAHVVASNKLGIASMLDLAGTKVAVVQRRAEAKDYIDIDAMIQSKLITLPQALAAGREIYGEQFNPQLTLKALCYFDDGTVTTLSTEMRRRLVEAVQVVDLANLPTLHLSRHNVQQDSEQ